MGKNQAFILPCFHRTMHQSNQMIDEEKFSFIKSIPATKLKEMIKSPHNHFAMPNEIMNLGNDD